MSSSTAVAEAGTPTPGGPLAATTTVTVHDAYRDMYRRCLDSVSVVMAGVVAGEGGRVPVRSRVVVNYCAGAGVDNILLARAIGGSGTVVAVDVDGGALERLERLAEKHGVRVETRQQDAALPVLGAAVATCLFGLHHMSDPRAATARWSQAMASGAWLITADWGTSLSDGSDLCEAYAALPPVDERWRLVSREVLAFDVPLVARAREGACDGSPARGTVVVRAWENR